MFSELKAFIDSGTVFRKHSNIRGVAGSESLTGAGVGLNADIAGRYQLNLELVKPIGSQHATDDRDLRGWVGLSANF